MTTLVTPRRNTHPIYINLHDPSHTVGVIVWFASTTRTLIRVIQIIARTCILGLVSLEPSSLVASHHTFKKPRLGYWKMWDPGGMMGILDLPTPLPARLPAECSCSRIWSRRTAQLSPVHPQTFAKQSIVFAFKFLATEFYDGIWHSNR